jgi:adenine/guanine phosphoribosyltransferase-like PRPP-binding protein
METQETLRMHASYMSEAFAPDMTPMIEKFLETTQYHDFDTIVGVGLSGALVVPTIARALGLKWAIVRKRDGSHSSNLIEGEIGQRWLFVDDFVASGATLAYAQEIVRKTFEAANRQRSSYAPYLDAMYVGTYEYHFDRMYGYNQLYDYNYDYN